MRNRKEIRGRGQCVCVVAEKAEGDKPKSNGRLDALTAILGLVPVISAALYLFGRAYEESYLLKLGLNPALFPIGIEDALISGYMTLWTAGMPVLTYLMLAVEVSLIAIVLAGLLLSIRRVSEAFGRLQLQPFDLPWPKDRPALKRAEAVAWRLFLMMAAIFFAFLCFGLLIVSAVSAGEKKGQRELDSVLSGERTLTEIYMMGSEVPVQGAIIRCNDNYCGYITPEGAFAVGAPTVASVRPMTPVVGKPATSLDAALPTSSK